MISKLYSFIRPFIVIGGTSAVIGASALLPNTTFPSVRIPSYSWPAYIISEKTSEKDSK